jgi:hypothetical protein
VTNQIPITQSPLSGNGVHLRPVKPQHVPFLYRAGRLTAHEKPYLFRGQIPTLESVTLNSQNDPCLVKFVILTDQSSEPVGICFVNELDLRNRFAKIGMFLVPGDELISIGARAVNLLLHYVFGNWDLRKIYAYTGQFPFERLKAALGTFFRLEGHLVAQYAYEGQVWDEDILAFYPTAFESFDRYLTE